MGVTDVKLTIPLTCGWCTVTVGELPYYFARARKIRVKRLSLLTEAEPFPKWVPDSRNHHTNVKVILNITT